MYNALKVAEYIISKCFCSKQPISNLRLQKLLYFVQIQSYRENDEPIFTEKIEAWQFGPVVPDVYYEYNMYGSSPILVSYNDSPINLFDKILIDEVVDRYDHVPVWRLVDITHRDGGAWDKTVKKKGLYSKITEEYLKEEALIIE